MRLYLDANALIYSIEGSVHLKNAVKSRVAVLDPLSGDELLTSRLSQLECRVKPIRDDLSDLLIAYDAMFRSGYLRIIEVSLAVIDRATTLRASTGSRPPTPFTWRAQLKSRRASFSQRIAR